MIVNILIAVSILVCVAVISALLLAICERYLQVNDSTEQHIEKIEFYLPSYNCGACGHVNCKQVAKGIINGEIKDITICKVISEDNANLIRKYCKENKIDIK